MRKLVLVGVMILLAACESVRPQQSAVPAGAGIYANTRGTLARLDGDAGWEERTWAARQDVSPQVQLLVTDPALAGVGQAQLPARVTLRRVAAVRADVDSAGGRRSLSAPDWVAADVAEFRVPVDIVPVPRQPASVRIVPRDQLAPGLYSVRVARDDGGSASTARFGVGWSRINQARYAQEVCVDRYAGTPPSYRRCGAAAVAQNSGLQVTLGKPVMRPQQGLVVAGTIQNRSSQTRNVPALRATAMDANGRTLGSWGFSAPTQQLRPGESASFQTELANPPPGIDRVNVSVPAS